MFLQIHTLVSYPASLLNRDDAGLAKRIPFGNATRLRVSSQCLKRHWREHMVEQLPDVPDGLRTRSFFTRCVRPRLIEDGVPADMADALVQALAAALIKGGTEESGEMSQPVLFGLREADYLVTIAREACRSADSPKAAAKALTDRLKSPDEKKNLAAMSKSAAGLTAAMFGRFVTSDLLSRVDAPIHVAHAFTVHAAETEMDYFTVVDDLSRDDETGAAHANQSELGAGVYYGHVVVDLPALVSNLTGVDATAWRGQEPQTTKRVVAELVRAICCRSPGAKLGSTAPYSRAEWVLLEVGAQQPRTLANAFLEAAPARGNLLQAAGQRLADQLARVDSMYGPTADARFLATTLDATRMGLGSAAPLDASLNAALTAALG